MNSDTDEDEVLEDIVFEYFEEEKEVVLSKIPNNEEVVSDKQKVALGLTAAILYSLFDRLETSYQTTTKTSLSNVLSKNNITDDKVIKEATKSSKKYATRRSAELIGKKILKDGSLIDNPNANYCINDTTREGIEKLVKQAIDEGWSNQELRDKLMDNYLFSKERAMTIARTETNMSDNNVALETFKAAGIKKKKWLTAQDDRVDPCCIDNEKQGVIGIDEPFIHGGIAPPAHPNCRCTLLAHI